MKQVKQIIYTLSIISGMLLVGIGNVMFYNHFPFFTHTLPLYAAGVLISVCGYALLEESTND